MMPMYEASDKLPGADEDMFQKPRSISSGAPLRQKVIVTHRSDMLLEEQVDNVRNVQDALQAAMQELDATKADDEREFIRQQINELRARCDQMMVVMKICHKINRELVYARGALQQALKVGGDVTTARKRVGWLEDRMERLLGKKRQTSEERGHEGGRNMMSGDGLSDLSSARHSNLASSSDYRQSRQEGGDSSSSGPLVADPFFLPGPQGDLPPPLMGMPPPNHLGTLGGMPPPSMGLPPPDHPSTPGDMPPSPELEAAGEPDGKDTNKKKKKKKKKKNKEKKVRLTDPREYPGSGEYDADTSRLATPNKPFQQFDQVTFPVDSPSILSTVPSDAPAMQVHIQKQSSKRPASQTSDDSSSSTGSSSMSTSQNESQSQGVFLTEDSNVSNRSGKSKASRVTIKSPEVAKVPEKEEMLAAYPKKDASDEYWQSEHHRFEYSEHVTELLELDPLSYHNMGLAIPGSFVEEPEVPDKLPWRPKKRDSEVTDIHRIALDRLQTKVHKMYSKVREASMLSVNDSQEQDNFGPSLISQFEITEAAIRGSTASTVSKPTLAKHVRVPGSKEAVHFPSLDKDRLGTSMSGRLVYYPNPLPYPEKAGLTKTFDEKQKVRDREFPRSSDHFSKSVPGEEVPAERIVDQRNLLKETQLTGTLYKAKVKPGRRRNSTEDKFRRMLQNDTPEVPKKQLKNMFAMATAAVRMQDDEPLPNTAEGKWRQMKPASGALDHSGLKWERVKSIVHTNLISPNDEERIDACRHLGQLKCGDTMVLYALRERLRHDERDRVVYEAAKALVTLGCWDEEVLQVLVHYLLNGNSDIRQDLLTTMISGRNVHYVDKSLPSFPDLSEILSHMCLHHEAEDQISFDAAVCLGKLCVRDINAQDKLVSVLSVTQNTRIRAQALEILVRQLDYRKFDVVEAIMLQLQKSPVWKLRKDAAKLLVYLGSKHVCVNNSTESIYKVLERRLWDDPNKAVKLEAAKALAALELFPTACERIEMKLEDPSEEVRSQAVISIGTLGMKNERIMRQLIEMAELDSSEYVRLMILRTFAELKSHDKRIVRALRDKDRGDGVLARAARQTMDQLGISNSKSREKQTVTA